MPRYLDPKIDLAFKRVFGEHKHLLISLLNALLPLPDEGQIEDLQYLTPEQVPEIPGLLKNSIVDVKCTDTQGRVFIVEMQMLWSPSFQKRIVFSASQAYVKQLVKGADYRVLQPVYALALVNDIFDHQTPEFYHHYQIVNLQNTHEKLKGLEFVFVELPKFKATTRTSKRMQVLWLRFMNEVGEDALSIDAELHANADIAQALKLVEIAGFTPEELDRYHAGLDQWRIETTLLGDAKAAGLAEGMEKGKAEGITEGVEKGLRQAIKALHASGMAVPQIAQVMQLPPGEVQRLLHGA